MKDNEGFHYGDIVERDGDFGTVLQESYGDLEILSIPLYGENENKEGFWWGGPCIYWWSGSECRVIARRKEKKKARKETNGRKRK